MNLLSIPARNARRKPLRFAMLVLLFALGVLSITALSILSEKVGESLEKKLTAYGANILITPQTEELSVSYGGINLGSMVYEVTPLDADATVANIRSIGHKERLAAVAPKLVTMREVSGVPVGIIGVDLNEELSMKDYWIVDGTFPGDEMDILVGSDAAARLDVAPGDSLAIEGSAFNVAGVLEPTGGEDDGVVFGHLSAVQTLTGRPGEASFVEVAALCAGCPIEDIVAQLRTALPGVEVKALRSVVQQRMYTIGFVQNLTLTVSLVILLTACAMVGVSMLQAVAERKKDIGILRSLGYSKPRVFVIFAAEAVAIGMLAGLIGYAGGFMASRKVLDALDMADTTVAFDPLALVAACGLFAAVSGLAAAYPAWKASSVDPAEALVSL
jgi:putative ABC transport system permease protein